MTERRFVSYAHEEFSADQLARFAEQYEGADMAALKGASEDRFPFLVRSESHPLGYNGCWWNPYCGIMIEMNDDAVEDYAFVAYLLEHAYPRFDSFDDADRWATDHGWPRKSLDDLPDEGG
ncbi:MAG TPA: hypothetical protein DDW52_13750 [Planctomycetaceae bacterium]|nr:hypothetical protein [Planctomycetaceae bacterium]